MKTETGIWQWEWSASRLKQNNEDRNVVGGLRGHLKVSEGDAIVLEVSGVCWSLGEWSHSIRILEDGQNRVGGAVGDWSWIGWESWQSDRDLDDLTKYKCIKIIDGTISNQDMCYELVMGGPTSELLSSIADNCQRELAWTYVLCPS